VQKLSLWRIRIQSFIRELKHTSLNASFSALSMLDLDYVHICVTK